MAVKKAELYPRRGFFGSLLEGGVTSAGKTTINASAIVNNTARDGFGGLAVFTASPDGVTITNSTISGNTAISRFSGGVYSNSPSTKIYNSTIAFNQAADTRGGLVAVGLAMVGSGATARLESTLVANNTYGALNDDLSTINVTITGHNNLVRASSASLPADTIVNRCPLLGPLRDNGGPTKTHALLSHSPGIDQGNNLAALGFDQRGSPDARVSGPAADIGAYEVQQGDIVFNNNFEGCP